MSGNTEHALDRVHGLRRGVSWRARPVRTARATSGLYALTVPLVLTTSLTTGRDALNPIPPSEPSKPLAPVAVIGRQEIGAGSAPERALSALGGTRGRLRALDCALGQGYLFARPVSANQMRELLASGPQPDSRLALSLA